MMPTALSLDHTLFDRGEGSSDEEPLVLQVLRAYCLGLIKTCWFVNNRVKSEHYYEVRTSKVAFLLRASTLIIIRKKTLSLILTIEASLKLLIMMR